MVERANVLDFSLRNNIMGIEKNVRDIINRLKSIGEYYVTRMRVDSKRIGIDNRVVSVFIEVRLPRKLMDFLLYFYNKSGEHLVTVSPEMYIIGGMSDDIIYHISFEYADGRIRTETFKVPLRM